MINQINKAMASTNAAIDEYILQFFGSEEKARAQAHLWVLEVLPPESFPVDQDEDRWITFEIETRYRLRPKTDQELELDS